MLMQRAVRRFLKASLLLRNRQYRRGLKLGIGAGIEHEGMLRSTRVCSLIDVGANVGQFSLVAKAFNPGIIVHGLEPLPDVADRYARLFGDDPRMHLHRVAAGAEAGKGLINVSGRPDSSSLLGIGKRQEHLFPGTAAASTLEITIVRADDLFEHEDFPPPLMIKLDVQGYELEALQGMPKLLSKAQYVYAELSFVELYEHQPLADEVSAWLLRSGFSLRGVYNVTYSAEGLAVQVDALFENRGEAANLKGADHAELSSSTAEPT